MVRRPLCRRLIPQSTPRTAIPTVRRSPSPVRRRIARSRSFVSTPIAAVTAQPPQAQLAARAAGTAAEARAVEMGAVRARATERAMARERATATATEMVTAAEATVEVGTGTE